MPELKRHRAPLLVCMAIVLALPLAGCGRRGALEAPESETRATQTSGARPGAAQASAPANEDGEPAQAAPQRPFILDAIL